MTTKLTLSIDDKVIDSAKKYAGKKGESLSAIIEHYLKSLSSAEVEKNKISQEISRMKGVLKLPTDKSYKSILTDALTQKHTR